MGHIINQCIVVSGFDIKRVRKAHKKAVAIFATSDLVALVGKIIPHAINGGAAFLIAPDGSKEGWDHSERGKAARADFITYLEGTPDLYLNWALIELGGDDGHYQVRRSPNDAERVAA